MTVSTIELQQARAGARIALVTPTWDTAREELERLAELAGDDATISRSGNDYVIAYDEGSVRFLSAASPAAERGHVFDQVIVRADAYTDDTADRYSPTLDTTGGTLTVDGIPDGPLDVELAEDGHLIVCPECGAQLADTNPGATIRHEADGAHAYQQ